MSMASQSSKCAVESVISAATAANSDRMNPKEIVQSTCEARSSKSESTCERIAVGSGCSIAAAAAATTPTTGSATTNDAVEAVSSELARSVIVVLPSGLHELQGDGRQVVDVIFDNYRSNNEDEEDDEHEEVKNRKANDPSPAQLGLLKRVNRRSDLATR